MISTVDLKEYISLGDTPGFYGYGKWSSEYYIIGIEEAGCYSEHLIQQKIDKYFALKHGDDGLFDNFSFQGSLVDPADPKLKSYRKFFSGGLKKYGYVPKIATLLKVLESCSLDKYEYVQKKFGSIHSNHSLIEILPLPCPNESSWLHRSWIDLKDLPFMNNKKDYRNKILSKRTNFIKSKIDNDRNKKLILFLANGTEKVKYWNNISPIDISKYSTSSCGLLKYHINSGDKKMYVVLPFPGSRSSNGIFNSEIEIIKMANLILSIYSKL